MLLPHTPVPHTDTNCVESSANEAFAGKDFVSVSPDTDAEADDFASASDTSSANEKESRTGDSFSFAEEVSDARSAGSSATAASSSKASSWLDGFSNASSSSMAGGFESTTFDADGALAGDLELAHELESNTPATGEVGQLHTSKDPRPPEDDSFTSFLGMVLRKGSPPSPAERNGKARERNGKVHERNAKVAAKARERNGKIRERNVKVAAKRKGPFMMKGGRKCPPGTDINDPQTCLKVYQALFRQHKFRFPSKRGLQKSHRWPAVPLHCSVQYAGSYVNHWPPHGTGLMITSS